MIHLPTFTEKELQRKAVVHRNSVVLQKHPDHFRATVERTKPETLLRWQVNYIRHCYTDYDSNPTQQYRNQVNEAIAVAYPWLAQEAKRQKNERGRALLFKSLEGQHR